jgi:hypothetical protein
MSDAVMSMAARFRLTAMVLVLISLCAAAWGQEEAPPAKQADQPFRELSIYIPYTRLRALFEKDGRGVFIPYEKFQELLNAAQNAAAKMPEIKPPVGGLITSIESEATIGRDAVLVKATLSIEVLQEGWVRVPLRLGDSAIRSAVIDQEPARLIGGEQGYDLLYENKGNKPEPIELTLEYSKAFTKAPGKNQVSFQAPQAAVNRWTIRIAEPGVKVNVRPQMATDDAAPMPADAKETVVEAHMGTAPEISFDWTPQAEGAAGLAALATVQTRQDVAVEEGVVRSRFHLAYEITRSELSELKLELSKAYKVVNVFDANVQKWEVADKEDDEATQVVTVQLFQPAKGQQSLSLEVELVDRDLAKNGVKIPAVKAVEAGRQFGVVAVRVAPSLRAEATSRSGLSQLDASELPPELAGQPWAFAFRYSALPYELTLALETVEPRIEATEFVEIYLEPRQFTIDYLASLNIERTGIFSIDVDIPGGYEVRAVTGRAYADVQPAAIDAFHVDAKKPTKLTVNFSRKALGKVAFAVQLVKRLGDAKLVTPGGTAAEKLSFPRVAHSALERAQGHAVIYAPDALQVTAEELTAVRNIAPAEAMAQGLSVRDGKMPTLRETLAFAFFRESPAVTFELERRKPQVTVRQTLTAMIESGVVNYTATFHYDIRYSSVKSLRLDVPEDLADEIRRQRSGTAILDPQPDDVAKGYKALQLTGEGEMLGELSIPFKWTRSIGELEVGKPMSIAIPRLQPVSDTASGAEIERAWGQVVIGKAETIDIEGTAKNLRPIDPQLELVDAGALPNPARAYEFHDTNWLLTILATRYELDDVKRTSIDRALVRVIATRGGKLSVQAIYRLRSAQQRVQFQLPAEADTATAFDAQPLHINGQSMPLERDGDMFYAPLTRGRPDEPVLVELRYTMPGTAADIELPKFTDKPAPAVQKVFATVYLPQERVVVGTSGPWNDEMPWRPPTFLVALGVVPPPESTDQSDARLLAWVTEGVAVTSSPADRFQIDGVARPFSTLRPPEDEAGALRLSVWKRSTLQATVFLIVLAAGAFLLTRPASDRIAGLGLLFAVVFLAAVFQPSLAGALLEGSLIAATSLVLLIWFVRYLIWLVRRAASATEQPHAAVETPFATAATANESPASPSDSEGGKV